jgi:hypothetical protein
MTKVAIDQRRHCLRLAQRLSANISGYTAETQMADCGIDRLRHARRWAVGAAIVGSAERLAPRGLSIVQQFKLRNVPAKDDTKQ